MTTLYRDYSRIQIWGSTTLTAPGEPTARAGAIITTNPVDLPSAPWRLYSNGRFTIELDSTDQGAGVLAVAAVIVQRSSMPEAYRFPLGVGVVWNNVPTAEMGLAAIAAQNIQQEEFQGSANYVYRLFLDNITANGNLWVNIGVPRRFSE